MRRNQSQDANAVFAIASVLFAVACALWLVSVVVESGILPWALAAGAVVTLASSRVTDWSMGLILGTSTFCAVCLFGALNHLGHI